MPSPFRRATLRLVAAWFAVSLGFESAEAGIAHLILYSDRAASGWSEYYDVVDPNAGASNIYPAYNLPNGDWTVVSLYVFQRSVLDASLAFSTHLLGIPIQVGVYENAQRFPFEDPGRPGLDVTLNSQGSNRPTGSFTITDISFYMDSQGRKQLGRFAATFDHLSSNGDWHMYGSITYFEPASVPEPSSISLLATASLAGLGLVRRLRLRAG